MAGHKTLDTLFETGTLDGKAILVRADLNVPMNAGHVTDATRLERLLPTIQELSEKGAKVLILSHFGRPKGERVPDMSLAPVAVALSHLLGTPVTFARDCISQPATAARDALTNGDVLVLENTRYHAGEENNDPEFAHALAKLADIYINDAFSVAHRAHASTQGIARLLPAYAGRAMEAELEALNAALGLPQHPAVAIVGGAKISTKLDLLGTLIEKVDTLVIGGGMANTFLAAKGIHVGKSLCEHDLGGTAREILAQADAAKCTVLLPQDVVIAREFKAHAPCHTVCADAVPADSMILDAGSATLATLSGYFEGARTVIWNGPLGAFELPPFDQATNQAAAQVAMLTKMGRLTSVAGGGDTVAALNNAGAASDFSYVSTAGGAFLEWLEGKTLPGIAALEA